MPTDTSTNPNANWDYDVPFYVPPEAELKTIVESQTLIKERYEDYRVEEENIQSFINGKDYPDGSFRDPASVATVMASCERLLYAIHDFFKARQLYIQKHGDDNGSIGRLPDNYGLFGRLSLHGIEEPLDYLYKVKNDEPQVRKVLAHLVVVLNSLRRIDPASEEEWEMILNQIELWHFQKIDLTYT
ncbi:hypothetical protein BBO_08298 [Beauveria brongniartii RCEF 3172]|uniref:Uncharacterized protein n=1 Tax=Beauveria brongniartii RCEF 3172 TaxID=1081107 RepID=A0A166XSA7_9HYPO|nr:hypothetical protein BBO_08298 [Beauveria brongniartii RCEF 3172]